ncbi:MAG TPA: HD domain-containing phosphohydrolase [Candidatus Limnocylindrales bacterium]|nr:HD domain-containing phosphohydrolase [Candidatus Limnocylindrales bacterium]
MLGPSLRVLIVEDDPANRELLQVTLRRAGYHPVPTADGLSALRAVASEPPDLVLLDVGLPGMDGLSVTRQLRDQPGLATLPIIMLTGRASTEDIVAGLDAGADDFVTKPFQSAELLARIRSAFRLRRAWTELEAAHGAVAALANAVEAKDATTERHCQRLAGHAYRLGQKAGLDRPELKAVVFGALLHDIGKIGIPEALLNKPAPLSEEEWAQMRRHPEIGEQICRPLPASGVIGPVIRHHHERWDGHGYPDELRGADIPIGARIVGLIDAFDAMTHDRPYRPALPVEVALEEVRANRGRQFDPELAERFLAEMSGNATMLDTVPLEPFLGAA